MYSKVEISGLFHKVLWKYIDLRNKNPQNYENENRNTEDYLKLEKFVEELGVPENFNPVISKERKKSPETISFLLESSLDGFHFYFLIFIFLFFLLFLFFLFIIFFVIRFF